MVRSGEVDGDQIRQNFGPEAPPSDCPPVAPRLSPRLWPHPSPLAGLGTAPLRAHMQRTGQPRCQGHMPRPILSLTLTPGPSPFHHHSYQRKHGCLFSPSSLVCL